MNQATRMAEEALEQFAKGKNDRQPEPQAIETARRLAEASLSRTRNAEIVTDHEGDLAFDLRNETGKLILAELTPEGRLHAGLYGADNAALASVNDGQAEDMLAWLDA